MDGKKQANLSPELKEIYDRVMNSTAKPQVVSKPTPTTSTPPLPSDMPQATTAKNVEKTQPSFSTKDIHSVLDTFNSTITPTETPSMSTPQMPQFNMASMPLNVPPIPSPDITSNIPNPQPSFNSSPGIPPVPNPAEQILTSTDPRPISEGNTFAFNGKAQNTPVPSTKTVATANKESKKSGISMPVIIGFGIIFLILWTVLWAFVFGLIKL